MVKAVNVVVGIFGHKGDGKTTTLTLFLYLEYQFGVMKHSFCNYKLEFPFEWLKGKDMIDLTNKLDDSVVGIDELQQYADSRDSLTLQNKRVSNFFLQSRHTNSNIYYSTQFKDQIDKRIQRITDIDIVTTNMYVDSDKDGDDDIFKLTILDRRTNSGKTTFYYAKPVFDMFDSRERINPFIFSEKEAIEWKKNLPKC